MFSCKQIKNIFFSVVFFSATANAADTTYVLKRISPVPITTDNISNVKLNLNGSWYFNPAPERDFENRIALNSFWKKIEVPGEWVMQGFSVEKNKWAGYSRSFTIPEDWKDKRIKLRCDGIYSECEIYINGKKVGYHLGGFTPFEFDVTNLVHEGSSSVITIKVKNESIADSLASGSQYAAHALGGITRKIYLMALPEVNISLFQEITTFDTAYKNAILKTQLQFANETKLNIKNTTLLFELLSPKTNEVVLSKRINFKDEIRNDSTLDKTFEFFVQQPKKWDPEHPNLYTYRITLQSHNATETVERKIGFRQIEIRGNRVFVNNMPIKLRGACRHETDPLRGRSLIGNDWVRDVKLFAEENVNYIRTSHFPPPEEFVHACDSLGMFLEIEAPFCWAFQTNVPADLYKSAILDQTLDMVNFFRSDPAVLDWSIANESQGAYNKYFHKSAELVKRIDPTRPRVYNQYGPEADNGELEFANFHYPGPDGPSRYADSKRPVVFNEYCHLNAYNRIEQVTDPGVRDAWGIGFKNMWEKMYATPAILGGCIWAGIDDTFILPDGSVVGYGSWGPLDDWRRKKPEYWHVKKTYSPVKIHLAGNYKNGVVPLIIENQMLFSNLNECKLEWHVSKFSGVINPSIKEGNKRAVSLKINEKLSSTDTLYINVIDPRNILIDQYAFEPVIKAKEIIKSQIVTSEIKYGKAANNITAQIGEIQISLDKSTGNIIVTKGSSKNSFLQLGQLMLLPLNGEGDGTQMTGKAQVFEPFTNTCSNRVVKEIEYGCLPGKFTVRIYDNYDEAGGYTQYEFSSDKDISIHYNYTVNKDINPRQWGIVVSLANDFNTISWKRKGLWSYYPKDHIGRLSGSAYAYSSAPISGPAGPVKKPTWSWSEDRNALGTNDFRSTKMYITEGKVQGNDAVLRITSDGSQSIRAWKDGDQTKLLIAGYSNLGDEGFFRSHAERFDKPLKQGDHIENDIHLAFQ